jgi:hypothetical protein
MAAAMLFNYFSKEIIVKYSPGKNLFTMHSYAYNHQSPSTL